MSAQPLDDVVDSLRQDLKKLIHLLRVDNVTDIKTYQFHWIGEDEGGYCTWNYVEKPILAALSDMGVDALDRNQLRPIYPREQQAEGSYHLDQIQAIEFDAPSDERANAIRERILNVLLRLHHAREGAHGNDARADQFLLHSPAGTLVEITGTGSDRVERYVAPGMVVLEL